MRAGSGRRLRPGGRVKSPSCRDGLQRRAGGLLLAGHLDTVPPKGNETPRRDGDTLWVRPDALTPFTTTFFGARDPNNWVSLVPQGLLASAADPARRGD